MGTQHREVGWSAREEVLSTDLKRMQDLSSKAIQDQSRYGSMDGSNTPISSFDLVPNWAPAAGFTVNYGPGAGHQFSTSGVGVDDSDFQVIEFPVTTLTFATPDVTNPRIDLIVGTAASVGQDLSARNILQDPNTRAQIVANVAKTAQPLTTLAVVTGTPAATPVPPAVPAGAVALHEVWVPAGAANSTAFPFPAPRLFRRATFPFSILGGILEGFHLRWDLTADITSTSSALVVGDALNVVVIDGEVIDCSALTGIPVQQDLANNPFGGAAGASDKPYYIYAVGGRHAPQGTLGFNNLIPIAVVESLTAPNILSGFPSANLQTARGTVNAAGAVYIGIGFVVATTTRRRPCIMNDNLTEIVGADFGGFMSLTKTGTGPEALGIPASKPSVSRSVLGLLSLGAASANGEIHLHPDRGDGVAAAPTSIGVGSLTVAPGVKGQVAAHQIYAIAHFFFNPLNATIWIAGTSINTGDVIQFTPMAYDHRVRRLGAIS